ncbi:MAG: serine/threonine protein kinase [Cyanophyceae cyanobacterium]
MTDPNIGRLLSDRYQLMELVGRGAMGRVYRARHVLLDAPVAVKFLTQALINEKMRDRFMLEARACFSLGQKSRNIVQVLDYDISDDEIPFYVMEFLEGRDLSLIIKQEIIPLPRFLNMAHQICSGLQAAHQGLTIDGKVCPIIHRDIKPSNLLVVQDPERGETVKILDFGIAKLLQDDQGQTSHFMGTLAYSSPEQMEGKELTSQADIYSLGIVMYEMLTGKMPLQADTHSFGSWYKTHKEQPPRPMNKARPGLKIPRALEQLVMQCLSKHPDRRPRDIDEILRLLEPMEHRYKPGRAIGRRIEDTLSRANVPEPGTEQSRGAAGKTVDPDTMCRLQTWPGNKPVAEIVFPHLIPSSRSPIVSKWVMLPEAMIETVKRRSQGQNAQNQNTYHRFRGAMTPHPMVLWLSVLDVKMGEGKDPVPKWLPCYLDLKRSLLLKLLEILCKTGEYRILFFALEDPQLCRHVAKVTLSSPHRRMLYQWMEKSKGMPATQANLSKIKLKRELEQLKPKIVQELES